MSFTKDKTIIYGNRVWAQDSHNSVPAYRQITLFTSSRILTRTRTGVGLPTYKSVISSGGNATTLCSGTYITLEGSRFSLKLIYEDGSGVHTEWARGDTSHYVGVPVFTPFPTTANARAAAKFIAECRDAAVRMSGPTFLGELRETKRMLRKPAAALWENIGDYLANVKRANKQNRSRNFKKDQPSYLRNLSKIASGLWLEKSFGWDPLMHDIADAKDAFESLIDTDRVSKVSVGGNDAKLGTSNSTTPLLLAGSHLRMRLNTRITYHTTVRYRGAVRCQAATTYADKAARFGFTPSEFVPTAWELLPWSFLADYFTNIGDVLSAAVTDTSNIVWSAKSSINKAVTMAYLVFDRGAVTAFIPESFIRSLTGSSGYVLYKTSSWSRDRSLPDFPSLYFKLPHSDKQLFNCAALLDQVGIDMNPQRPRRRNYRL